MLKDMALTQTQLMVLAGLTFALCTIFAGLGTMIYINQDILFLSPPPPTTEAVAIPVPSPTATPTSTFTPNPFLTLPQAVDTAVPTPTATYAVSPEEINQDKINSIIEFVEKTRKLRLPHEIPINFLTRRQLREQWQNDSFDKTSFEAAQTQQEFYIALGLIEPGVNLLEAAFTSRENILLGYYTPDEKVMYIIAESINMFAQEEMTFAHEYVHALQDNHFDLGQFLNFKEMSGDTLLAARSLPEGDARLVEDLFTRQNINQDQLDYNVYRYLFQEQTKIEGVSPALGIFTYFPYTAGEYFVFKLFIKGGYNWTLVNQAYSKPPISSEQVMHPEKYLADEKPILVNLPNLSPVLGNTWHEVDQGVLGEIGFLVWLIDKVEASDAINSSAGWGGDAYTLWVDDAENRVLAEFSTWESEADATEFFKTFNSYMNLREKQAVFSSGDNGSSWEYKGGITLVLRNKTRVLIVIAPNKTVLTAVTNQFAGF